MTTPDEPIPGNPPISDQDRAEAQMLAGLLAPAAVPQPDTVTVEMTLDDAHELTAILMSDRYRMDKGDDRDVPQPRWGANVRVAKAVHAAIDARLAPKES